MKNFFFFAIEKQSTVKMKENRLRKVDNWKNQLWLIGKLPQQEKYIFSKFISVMFDGSMDEEKKRKRKKLFKV